MHSLDTQYNKIRNDISNYGEKIKGFKTLYYNEQDQKILNFIRLDHFNATVDATANLSEKQIKELKSDIILLKIDFQHALQAASETLCTLTKEGLEEEEADVKAQALINIATTSLRSPKNTLRTREQLTQIINDLVACINTHMTRVETQKKDPNPLSSPANIKQADLDTLVSECISKFQNKELLKKFMSEKILPLLGDEAHEVLKLVKDEFSSGANYAIDTSYHNAATWFSMKPESTNKSLMVQIALRLVDEKKKYLSMDKSNFMITVGKMASPENILRQPAIKGVYNNIKGSSRAGYIQKLQFEEI